MLNSYSIAEVQAGSHQHGLSNVPAERLQVTFATPPRSLNSPLQPGCYAAGNYSRSTLQPPLDNCFSNS
jgi:hypothetical protein